MLRLKTLRSSCKYSSPVLKQDDGAVAVIVLLFFSSFLFIGLLAIVVDVGAQYQERRVLQKAADSMALAIGQDCVESNRLGLCTGTGDYVTSHPASRYSSMNSDDKISAFKVCGRGGGLGDGCNDDTDKFLDCKSVPGSANYVRVRLVTRTQEGASSLPSMFGKLLRGSASSSQLRACAQVLYGAAQEAPVIFPLILPICGYQDVSERYVYVDAGTGANALVDSPTYVDSIYVYKKNSGETRSTYKTLREWDQTASNGGLCKYKPVGLNWTPEGDLSFMDSYLSTNKVLNGASLFTCVGKNPDQDCKQNSDLTACPNLFEPLDIAVGDFVRVIDEGNTTAVPNNCFDSLNSAGFTENTPKKQFEAYLNKYVIDKIIYVPVFRSWATKGDGTADNTALRVIGFYAVGIEGMALGSSAQAGTTPTGGSASNNSAWPPSSNCTNSKYCLSGYFTRATPPSRRAPANSENLGVGYVYLIP